MMQTKKYLLSFSAWFVNTCRMEPAPGTQSKESAFTKIISHPITGFVVGMAGIALAVYFYCADKKEPRILLEIHPVQTSIVQAGRVSELSVSLHGRPVTSDLTAAQFMIWNSGKAPVRHEDILKPIILNTTSNVPIYEVTVRNVSRDVIGFQLITNDIASGRLGFDWKILEHNDGASIQVIYGGPTQLRFFDEGIVVGQNSIPYGLANVAKKTRGAAIVDFVCALVGAGFFALGTFASFRDMRKAIKQRQVRKIVSNFVVFTICMGATIAFVSSLLTSFTENKPPFQF